ncbi:pyridoxamine 5'-phosphate oxidase family protein [Peptostreptococcus canis]|nr:pyridoxamine 5'-phosphate oxidase family protein [Peptostreptococcus canis]MBP1998349.1 putative pyridoxamine 5'-phosphate oxidase family protein [Peptostreptococcus canis]
MKVLDFLKQAKVFYAATVDGDQPRVRPLGFVMDYNGKLCFYVDSRANMYKQMQINPKMEISAIDEKMNTLRLTGKAVFLNSEDAQAKALEVFPMLAKMGYKVGLEAFQVYSLEDIKMSYTSLMGENLEGIEL